MRESGNCRTTDGALSSSSSLGNRGKKRATKLTRQKLFHYMPTLHSGGGGSSFWRDGWQRSLRARRRTRVWDFWWSEVCLRRRGKGWKSGEFRFGVRERERKASLTAAVCIRSRRARSFAANVATWIGHEAAAAATISELFTILPNHHRRHHQHLNAPAPQLQQPSITHQARAP